MAERGRIAMAKQFKRFYMERNADIIEHKVGNDYFALHAMFAEWLEGKANRVAIVLSEKGRNVLLAKTLRDWDAWVVIVDRTAEELVFETFHAPEKYDPPISPPSPPGKVGIRHSDVASEAM